MEVDFVTKPGARKGKPDSKTRRTPSWRIEEKDDSIRVIANGRAPKERVNLNKNKNWELLKDEKNVVFVSPHGKEHKRKQISQLGKKTVPKMDSDGNEIAAAEVECIFLVEQEIAEKNRSKNAWLARDGANRRYGCHCKGCMGYLKPINEREQRKRELRNQFK